MAQDLVENPFINNDINAATQNAPDGELSGLSVAVKDLFHIAGLPTTAGNPDWLASHALPEVTNSAVRALLDAGATYRGKTITDELAYSLNGQNCHHGTPINPVTPDRLPGGSSSGSAVAVAASLTDIGLGTDTGGSIRVPASYNGLFGLRPTHGDIPCDNMVPLAPSFDTVGWMTASLAIMEKTANVLLPKSNVPEIETLGIAQSLVDDVEHKDVINTWLRGIEMPQSSVDIDLSKLKTADSFSVLQVAEIWQQHGKWLRATSPAIADDIQARFNWCETLTASDIDGAKTIQQDVIAHLDGLFSTVDAIVMPTTPGLSPLLTTPAEALAQYRNQLLGMTAIAGLCGLPQLHLPLFTLHGAPCGLSLLGPKGSDRRLITLAARLLDKNNDE